MQIIVPERKDMTACAKVYIAAYNTEPWNEVYTEEEVTTYISGYLNSDARCCYALMEDGQVKGVALGLIIPSIPNPYLRIEDFCVEASVHRKGYGSIFMELLLKEVVKAGCDAVLLGTQKGYPAHQFYLKNGFQEVESVLLYKEIE